MFINIFKEDIIPYCFMAVCDMSHNSFVYLTLFHYICTQTNLKGGQKTDIRNKKTYCKQLVDKLFGLAKSGKFREVPSNKSKGRFVP